VDKLSSGCWSCLWGTARWVPLVRKSMIIWWHPRDLPSLLSLSAVTHAEWIADGGVFIPFTLCPGFSCGTNEFVPGSISDSSGWWPLSFLPFSFLFLWFITDNWFLIIQLLYPWDFSRVNTKRFDDLWNGGQNKILDLVGKIKYTQGLEYNCDYATCFKGSLTSATYTEQEKTVAWLLSRC
jgi:hypothetical protein